VPSDRAGGERVAGVESIAVRNIATSTGRHIDDDSIVFVISSVIVLNSLGWLLHSEVYAKPFLLLARRSVGDHCSES
jgi:hypothetical protein